MPKFNTSRTTILEKQKGSIWSGALFRPTNFFVMSSKYSRIGQQIQSNCRPNTLELLTKYSVFADQFDCNCSAIFVLFLQVLDSQHFTNSLKTRVFGGEFRFFQNVAILTKLFVGKIHGTRKLRSNDALSNSIQVRMYEEFRSLEWI